MVVTVNGNYHNNLLSVVRRRGRWRGLRGSRLRASTQNIFSTAEQRAERVVVGGLGVGVGVIANNSLHLAREIVARAFDMIVIFSCNQLKASDGESCQKRQRSGTHDDRKACAESSDGVRMFRGYRTRAMNLVCQHLLDLVIVLCPIVRYQIQVQEYPEYFRLLGRSRNRTETGRLGNRR